MAAGPPEAIVKESYTGAFLKPVLARGGEEAEDGGGGLIFLMLQQARPKKVFDELRQIATVVMTGA